MERTERRLAFGKASRAYEPLFGTQSWRAETDATAQNQWGPVIGQPMRNITLERTVGAVAKFSTGGRYDVLGD